MQQGTMPTPSATSTSTATASADAAAKVLGDEMTRLVRLIHAWKQRNREDPRGGDRVLLARLVNYGPRRATDLAAEALLDLSTVSRQIRSLVDRGLVERRPDPDDRRGALLSATPDGVIVFQQYRDQRNQRLAALLESWSAEDRHQLVRLFGRLNDDLAESDLFGGAAQQTTGQAAEQGASK